MSSPPPLPNSQLVPDEQDVALLDLLARGEEELRVKGDGSASRVISHPFPVVEIVAHILHLFLIQHLGVGSILRGNRRNVWLIDVFVIHYTTTDVAGG